MTRTGDERLAEELSGTRAIVAAGIEAYPGPIGRFDRDHRILSASRRALELLGFPEEEVIGHTVADLGLDGQIVTVWHQTLDEVFRSARRLTRDMSVSLPTGHRHLEVTIVPERAGNGGPESVVAFARDVTEERRAHEELARLHRLTRFGSWRWDPSSDQITGSPELYQTFGIEPGAGPLTLDEWLEAVHPEDVERVRSAVRHGADTGSAFSVECRLVARDGSRRWIVVLGEPVRGTSGDVLGVDGIVQDMTNLRVAEEVRRAREGDLRAAQRELVEREARLQALVDNSPSPIVRYDPDLRIIAINDAAVQATGIQRDRLLGHTHSELPYPRDLVEFWDANLGRVLGTGQGQTFEFCMQRPDGDARWYESHAAPEIGPDGSILHIAVSSHDVTDRKRAEQALAHNVLHDALTGLVNRQGLLVEMQRALDRQRRTREPVAALVLDLDRFKVVNDSLGHVIGDHLLTEVARRLNARLRPTDLLARIGGDEFVVLLEDLADETEAARVATRLLRALREPFEVDRHELVSTGSVGIVVTSSDGNDEPGVLLSHGEAAMYLSKERGRDRYEFFDERLQHRVDERLELERDLRRAAEQGELRISYQPEVDLRTGRVVGAEALLRWNHPRRGLLPIGDAIRIAEESGLAPKLGELVIDSVCAQIAAWKARGLDRGFGVSTNVSPVQLADREFAGMIRSAMERHGLERGDLRVEIVETALMADTPTIRENLRVLDEELGVAFAIDDFGTGYSSLAYIKRLPARMLKIDRSFVSGLPDDAENRAIVGSVAALARSLNLTTTAEGVETEAQADALRGLGVDAAQGFLYSPAVSPDAMTALLTAPQPPWVQTNNERPAKGPS